MAYIEGIKAGLVPVESAEHEKRREAKAKQPKLKAAPDEIICDVCLGQIGFNTSRTKHTNPCRHCRDFFGLNFTPGVTNEDPEDALEKMAKLREAKWGMLLRSTSFAVANGGASIAIEAGDVFPVQRAGNAEIRDTKSSCSKDRTWALFTATIQIGQHELTLFPHEISAMAWLTVMELRREGELVEQFVSADDKQGHFTPSPQLRAEINEVFGHLIR